MIRGAPCEARDCQCVRFEKSSASNTSAATAGIRSPPWSVSAATPLPNTCAACLGILRLVRSYGPERREAACRRGMDTGARTYGSMHSILRNGLDKAYRPELVPDELPVQHENIRGSDYCH